MKYLVLVAGQQVISVSSLLLATEPDAGATPMVSAGVLLSLVFIFLASKLGGGLSKLVVLNPSSAAIRQGLLIAAFLIVAAIIGKAISGLATIGKEPFNRLTIEIGMIPCGEMGLVFAGIGKASNVLINPCRRQLLSWLF